MASDANELKKALKINQKQAEFYDSISFVDEKEEFIGYSSHRMANLVTRIWASLRYRQQRVFEQSGAGNKKDEFITRWIRAKQGGRFLEIGCFQGTRASWPLIESAGNYVGVDLSEHATEVLSKTIAESGFSHKASAKAVDFLLLDESDKFDIVFAHGVLHHFEDAELLFCKIDKVLSDDGVLIFTEPSAVNLLYRIVRAVYRPFQSDAAWEFPFSRKTVNRLHAHFKPEEAFGWGRWSMPLSLIVGIPVIGWVTRSFYYWLLKRELSEEYSKRTWENATVTGAFSKKNTPRRFEIKTEC